MEKDNKINVIPLARSARTLAQTGSGVLRSLGALIIGLPFIVGLVPQSGDSLLILVPFLILSAALIFGNKLPKLPARDGLLLLLLLLWLVWGVSGILSPVPFPSKVTWIVFAALPLSYMVFITTKTDITHPLLITGGLFALFTLYSFATGTNRPDFPFEDANLLGILMALCTITAFKNKKTLYIAPLFLAAMIVTESRTAFLSLIAGAGVYVYLSPIKFEKSKRLNLVAGTLAMAGLVAALTVFSGFDNRLAHTAAQSAGRIALWTAAWDMAWIKPLTGLGLGTFHLHYPPYRLAGDNSLGYMVHMEPLQSAVESGWISVVLLYAVFVFAAVRILKNRQKNALPAALLTILFVSMHLTYPLHVVAFLVVMGAALGMLHNHLPQKEKNETDKAVPNPVFPFSLLLTILLCCSISINVIYTFLLWGEVKKTSHLHDRNRFDTVMSACLEDADPTFPDCRMMAARFILMSPQKDQKDFTRAAGFLYEAEKSNPLNAEIPFLQAQFLFMTAPEKTEETRRLLDKSLAINPTFWPARKLAITIALSEKDKKSAKTYLEKGMIYPYSEQTRRDIERTRDELDASN